jgi:GNAT superfamily N-acetyltransferase
MPRDDRADMNPIDAVAQECFRSFAILPDARLIDSHGVFGVMTRVPLTFFNGIATSGIERDEVPHVIEQLRANGRPFRWWISPSTKPADLDAVLIEHGMRHLFDSTGMSADLRTLRASVATPDDFTIRVVDTLEQWLHVFLTGFQRPAEEEAIWRGAYAQCDDSWTHLVGFLGETPIATTSLLLRGELAGVYHVVTLPAFRGRGSGAAMTLAAMQYARDAGAITAALQSSAMGFSVYRSVGFVDEGPLRLYDWRP